MARRNATDDTPAALNEALDFIEENTGLMGDANPGKAHLSAGGTTLMVMSDRRSFDYQDVLLDWLNDRDDIRFSNIGSKSTFDGKKAYIELKAE